jgi:tRNA threonylcarbamoyladenosine biosynthesis protein TsaE
MDLYRLSRASEISDLGWEDNLGEGVIVVEWAERLDFDGEAIRIHIRVDEEGKRRITISR